MEDIKAQSQEKRREEKIDIFRLFYKCKGAGDMKYFFGETWDI